MSMVPVWFLVMSYHLSAMMMPSQQMCEQSRHNDPRAACVQSQVPRDSVPKDIKTILIHDKVIPSDYEAWKKENPDGNSLVPSGSPVAGIHDPNSKEGIDSNLRGQGIEGEAKPSNYQPIKWRWQ